MASVIAYRGLPFSCVITFEDGISAAYTQAKFQVRDMADETMPLLLSADETSGVTINPADGTVSILIGAAQTGTLQVTNRSRTVKGQIRLYNPSDADDTKGSQAFDIVLSPEVIDDV